MLITTSALMVKPTGSEQRNVTEQCWFDSNCNVLYLSVGKSGLSCLPWKEEIAGSNPAWETKIKEKAVNESRQP